MRPDDDLLIVCRYCGPGYCGRVIDLRDGSVLPMKDTGFRFLTGGEIAESEQNKARNESNPQAAQTCETPLLSNEPVRLN